MKNSIWVHTIVYNEENFLWFAVMSVANFVDKILIWDTGSTDRTLEVIKKLQEKLGAKIDFKEVGLVDSKKYTNIRQEMLDNTKADWLIILDADEVWWENSIKKVINTINEKGKNLNSIVVPFFNCLGDIYHYQDERAGKYEIDGKRGHLTVKAINRKIPGLHLANPYGSEGFFDKENIAIQKMNINKRLFLDAPFLHLTHLPRTSRSNPKLKYELGKKFPKNFKYPEVFYTNRPNFIKSPFVKRNTNFLLKSSILEIPRRVKRRLHG
jgi:glycosyltransferase involved in cell wall biosynthesis